MQHEMCSLTYGLVSIHHPEDAPGRTVGRLGHDVRDQGIEGQDREPLDYAAPKSAARCTSQAAT